MCSRGAVAGKKGSTAAASLAASLPGRAGSLPPSIEKKQIGGMWVSFDFLW